jgi:hypothetical protein
MKWRRAFLLGVLSWNSERKGSTQGVTRCAKARNKFAKVRAFSVSRC